MEVHHGAAVQHECSVNISDDLVEACLIRLCLILHESPPIEPNGPHSLEPSFLRGVSQYEPEDVSFDLIQQERS
jgi:hypothetical protein